MAYTGKELVDQLALRIEDPNKKIPDSSKIMALNNAQYNLIGMLHNNYLVNELSSLKTGVTVASGVTATLNKSLLTYNVIKGSQGILDVKVTSGLYATRISVSDLKRNENKYLEGTVRNPLYYVFQNKIYMLPTSISSIEITFLRFPAPIMLTHTSNAVSPTPVVTSFVGTAVQLGSVDDTYNNQLIYHNQLGAYHVITNYIGTSQTVEVSPSSTVAFSNSQTFYFLSSGWDELNINSFTCKLAEWLTPLMLDLAEAECWLMFDKAERSKEVISSAIKRINELNQSIQEPEGIGVNRVRGE